MVGVILRLRSGWNLGGVILGAGLMTATLAWGLEPLEDDPTSPAGIGAAPAPATSSQHKPGGSPLTIEELQERAKKRQSLKPAAVGVRPLIHSPDAVRTRLTSQNKAAGAEDASRRSSGWSWIEWILLIFALVLGMGIFAIWNQHATQQTHETETLQSLWSSFRRPRSR